MGDGHRLLGKINRKSVYLQYEENEPNSDM
jgi:hypothetical protein